MTEATKICGNCRYIRKREVGRLECRFNPPVFAETHDDGWPAVEYGDWCGRWNGVTVARGKRERVKLKDDPRSFADGGSVG